MNISANLVFKFLARSPINHLNMTMTNFLTIRDSQRSRLFRFKLFLLLLAIVRYYNGIRECSYLTRSAILPPYLAPWRHLMDNGDPSSFLLMTGLTQEAFNILLDIIKPPGHHALRKAKGRKWSLPPDAQLGLLLFYVGSTMSVKHLCLLFGITPSVCSRILSNMLKLVVRTLRHHPVAKVEFPDEEKMQQFAQIVCTHEPSVQDVIGFMDGVSFTSECTSEKIRQNAFYCGYDCDTMVNNVFAYGPDGKVFFCAINYPGSWADGSLTVRFLPHILKRIGTYKICVDQGFPRSGPAWNVLVGPINQRTARRLHPRMREYVLRVSNVHTSLRQASEWGIRGMQGSFPRCKKRLPT
jgi:hypothetical protein